jgi:hypothetical protein
VAREGVTRWAVGGTSPGVTRPARDGWPLAIGRMQSSVRALADDTVATPSRRRMAQRVPRQDPSADSGSGQLCSSWLRPTWRSRMIMPSCPRAKSPGPRGPDEF